MKKGRQKGEKGGEEEEEKEQEEEKIKIIFTHLSFFFLGCKVNQLTDDNDKEQWPMWSYIRSDLTWKQ